MRTEVKIGLIIGLVAIAAVIVFFVDQSRRAASPVSDVVHFDAPQPTGEAESGEARTAARTPSAERVPVRSPTRTAPPRAEPSDIATREQAGRQPTGRPTGPTLADDLAERIRQRAAAAGSPVRTPSTQPAVAAGADKRSKPATRPTAQRTTPGVPLPRPAGSAERSERQRSPLPGAPPARGTVKHIIAPGDTLWALAEWYYDDGRLHHKIADANPEVDPAALPIGREIIIPPKDAPAASGRSTPPRRSPATGGEAGTRLHTYVVELGDSLTSIARDILDDSSRWRELFELNKDLIEDPDVLPIGIELKLPKK